MKQRILLLVILLCICCQTFSINFYNPKLCSDGSATVSCSQQLNKENEDACTIQANDVCHKNVKIENRKPLVQEKDASFSFNMVPYPHTRVDDLAPSIGLNISFQTSNPNLTGFYFFIIQQTDSDFYNSCRIFDFQKARDLPAPVTDVLLYYDCYKGMELEGFLIYNVIVRAVPSNEELVYKVLLPSTLKNADSELCHWTTLLMVNSLGLERNIVELKFTPANFTVDFYLVQLKNSENTVPYNKNVYATERRDMISITFENIANGQYTIFIIPNAKDECMLSDKMDIFVLGLNGIFHHQWVFAFILCGCIITVVLLGFIMHKICHRIGHNDSDRMQNLPKPKGVLLYSFDCPKHMDVVMKLAKYLKSWCNMDILIDEENQRTDEPIAKWLDTSLADAHFAVIVISQGIKHKVDYNNEPTMEEESDHLDRFKPTFNVVLSKAGNNDIGNEHNQSTSGPGSFQVLKVYFDYSRSCVPRTSQIFKSGAPFLLMSQMNQFLCQIHCQQSKTFPIKIYPKMPGSDFMTNAEGKALVKAIEDMKAFQKDDPLWFKKTLKKPAIDVEEAVGISGGAALWQVKEEDESIEALQANDESGKIIKLNVENVRKASPSNSKKSVTIYLEEENHADSAERQELLNKEKVEDETV